MILVSGSLAYDYIMDFPGYFRDHLNSQKLHSLSISFTARELRRNFGGTAGNIAYNLALLGERPFVISAAGNDFKPYQAWLSKHGVNLSLMQVVKEAPTASVYIITDQADCQIAAFYPGAMREKIKNQKSKIKNAIQNAKLAIVAPGNTEDMRVLPKIYKKYGVPYVYDPGQAIPALSGKDLREGISKAKVFISNDYELAMVLKKTKWSKKELLRRVGILVTTLGEKGSVIEISNFQFLISKQISNSKFQIQKFIIPPARPKNTGDPTGAGDAYRAGLIKGLLMGLSYDKMGKLASTLAVYTVEKYGTQTHYLIWPDLLKRYQKNFKEKLLSL